MGPSPLSSSSTNLKRPANSSLPQAPDPPVITRNSSTARPLLMPWASIDAYGNHTSFVYDSDGRQIAVQDYLGNFSAGAQTRPGKGA
jgi:hypothetical protein